MLFLNFFPIELKTLIFSCLIHRNTKKRKYEIFEKICRFSPLNLTKPKRMNYIIIWINFAWNCSRLMGCWFHLSQAICIHLFLRNRTTIYQLLCGVNITVLKWVWVKSTLRKREQEQRKFPEKNSSVYHLIPFAKHFFLIWEPNSENCQTKTILVSLISFSE